MSTTKPTRPRAKPKTVAKSPAKGAAKTAGKGAAKTPEKASPKPKTKVVKRVARKVVKADQAATHALAAKRRHPLVRVAGWLSEAADQPPLITASLGTLAIGLVTKRADLARGGARMLASHLLATGAKLAIKHQIDRTRPSAALDSGKSRFEAGDTGGHEEKSFPSGHTAGAVAVALAAAEDIDGAALPAALATGAVAAMQAPAGNHYLTDVIVGGAVGWAAEAVVSAVFDRWEPTVEAAITGNPLPTGEAQPPKAVG